MNVLLSVETNGRIEDVVISGTYGRKALIVAIPKGSIELHALCYVNKSSLILSETQKVAPGSTQLNRPVYLWRGSLTKVVKYDV